MSFKVFLRGSYSIDAVEYYIKLVMRAAEESLKMDAEIVYDIDAIDRNDIVFVIDAKSHFFVWLKYPKIKVISWFQGVLPEENKMLNPKWTFVNSLRIKWWEFLESFSLQRACCNMFVSERMKEHYEFKYGYKKKNYLIMPCYNQHINSDAILIPGRYEKAAFVYAGSLADWQCIRETLVLFKLIKEKIAGATLTLYTKELEKANQLIIEYGVNDVHIEYIPYEKINEKLAQFKYGFLLRRDHIVNNVATPTKMNTYLANGVIPVYSDVVRAFTDHIKSRYSIIVENQAERDLEKIISFEKQTIVNEMLLKDYLEIFNNYYNDQLYIDQIKESNFYIAK